MLSSTSLEVTLTLPPHPSSLSSKPSLISTFIPVYAYHHSKNLRQKILRNGTCRAEFSHDAPIAIAIGACMLNSLVFPVTPSPYDDEESESVIDSSDARFAVMGIISFIPYFNWMSWVFAWLDTGKSRYAAYAIVYLAPYLRSNFSLSREESWLPIAGILLCIIHIQLEVSIKNGDLQGFQIFGETAKHLSSVSRKKESGISDEERKKSNMNLPSAHNKPRNDIGDWRVPGQPTHDSEHYSEDGEANSERKH